MQAYFGARVHILVFRPPSSEISEVLYCGFSIRGSDDIRPRFSFLANNIALRP